MAQQNVDDVIHRLLTDEELRMRFAADRFDAMAELQTRGVSLTPDEIDLFIRSDTRLWICERIYISGPLN